MAEKIIFSKQELKRHKDLLKRFQRYLPTLTLKMQQLKLHLNRIEAQLQRKIAERDIYVKKSHAWNAVFGEEVDIEQYIQIERVQISHQNLAGISIPHLVSVAFVPQTYDLFHTPLWLDHGITYLHECINLDAEIEMLRIQCTLIEQELRTTTQRVNLFEKIRIPHAKKTIAQIVIYLGDQHTAAVVRGKIAKKKIMEYARA